MPEELCVCVDAPFVYVCVCACQCVPWQQVCTGLGAAVCLHLLLCVSTCPGSLCALHRVKVRFTGSPKVARMTQPSGDVHWRDT